MPAYKALKISTAAYEDLKRIRELEMEQAKRNNDADLLAALVAMGLGAFFGWLTWKVLRDIYGQRSDDQ